MQIKTYLLNRERGQAGKRRVSETIHHTTAFHIKSHGPTSTLGLKCIKKAIAKRREEKPKQLKGQLEEKYCDYSPMLQRLQNIQLLLASHYSKPTAVKNNDSRMAVLKLKTIAQII